MTPSGIEHATLRLAVQFLNQLRHREPPSAGTGNKKWGSSRIVPEAYHDGLLSSLSFNTQHTTRRCVVFGAEAVVKEPTQEL